MAATQFRDMTILYIKENQQWLDYLLKQLRNDQLKMRLETLAIDTLQTKNPAELEVAIRESHVLVMLTTSTFLEYMEEEHQWFSNILDKSDPVLSVMVYTLVQVSQDELEDVCKTNNYTYHPENCLEVKLDGTNIRHVITHIIQEVERVKNNVPPPLPQISDGNKTVTVIPSKLPQAGEQVALLFHQQIQGDVTVYFRHVKEDVVCEMVNPYSAVFTMPVIDDEKVSMVINIDGVKHSRHRLVKMNSHCQFLSVEFMCQAYGTSSKEELDLILANHLSKSICPPVASVFDGLPSQFGASEGRQSAYPTMLHWAAANGLKELSSALLSAPGASLACDVRNADGRDPINLARENGYAELSDLIDEFIDTQDIADMCDTYVSYTGRCSDRPPQCDYIYSDDLSQPGAQQHDKAYADMTACKDKGLKSPYFVFPDADRHNFEPPPLPPPRDSVDMSPHATDIVSTPPNPVVSPGAVGCRSQEELIEIQEEVKKGNFSIQQAEMLYKSWIERNKTGNAMSFKERQQKLKEFREENLKAMEVLKNAKVGKKINKRDEKKKSGKGVSTLASNIAVNISEPILTRQRFGSSQRLVGAGRGDSTNSNVSVQSIDSGRASNISTCSIQSHTSSSSDDTDNYILPRDLVQPVESRLRSRQSLASLRTQHQPVQRQRRPSLQEFVPGTNIITTIFDDPEVKPSPGQDPYVQPDDLFKFVPQMRNTSGHQRSTSLTNNRISQIYSGLEEEPLAPPPVPPRPRHRSESTALSGKDQRANTSTTMTKVYTKKGSRSTPPVVAPRKISK